MLTWKQLAGMSDAQLETIDIATMNLACAVDLPDSERINVGHCLRWLDRAKERVRQWTDHSFPQFERNPAQFENSANYFRILAMISVLVKEFGVRYNPAKVSIDVPMDTADTFLHGVIQGDGGTCASLPVLYAAVGRRLGYPIKLVCTKTNRSGHCFARWDGAGERFNIDVNQTGLSCNPDDYYRTGVFHLTADEGQRGHFLQSRSPREELALFLCNRAHCWRDVGNHRRTAEAMAWAAALAPYYLDTLKGQINRWIDKQEVRMPTGFPPLLLHGNSRRFPETLPFDVEMKILGMEAVDNMLDDPEQDRRYWEPMRRGVLLPKLPTKADAYFEPDGRCSIELTVAPVMAYKFTK